MLQLSPQSRIFLATEPVDFRKGIDGLAAVCRQVLREPPLSGAVFVFRNRAATALKLLVYDGQGFWLCTKRLSQGRFHWWPHGEGASALSAFQRFAQGLRDDYAAVRAGVTLSWSNGPVEGHINRLKMLKRHMVGRAHLDLLSRRFVLAPREGQAQVAGPQERGRAHPAPAAA